MKTILLGKKPGAARALQHLLKQGFEVTLVVAPASENEKHWQPTLLQTARDMGIQVTTDDVVYNCLAESSTPPDNKVYETLQDVDLLISYLYWQRIKEPLLSIARKHAINFHPAPLPGLRGVGGYNIAILQGFNEYGVSAHYITKSIDAGPLVGLKMFTIDPATELVSSIEKKSQESLFQLFKDICRKLKAGTPLKTLPAEGPSQYISKRMFERLRTVMPTDPAATVAGKARAFWYPPYAGAEIHINGMPFTVIDEQTLRLAGQESHHGQLLSSEGFLHENAYRTAVAGLTLKYVDVLIVRKSPGHADKFVLGIRREDPGRGYTWPMGGRSKHFMPYDERAQELVREDLGLNLKCENFFHIGHARLLWPDSRWGCGKPEVKTDGDIVIYAVEISEKDIVTTGSCFTNILELCASDTCRENAYLKHLIDAYSHHKKTGGALGEIKMFSFDS